MGTSASNKRFESRICLPNYRGILVCYNRCVENVVKTIGQQLQAAGMSAKEIGAKVALFDRCAAALDSPHTFLFVPGRIEFLGKHTDYAGGRSLICAVERGICAAVAPRSDAHMRVIDATKAPADACEFALDPDLTPRIGHWSNYPMTVARRVARNFGADGQSLRGAEVAFASDLPQASGMSSSSALVIAIFLALDAVNGLKNRRAYLDNIHSIEHLAGYLGTVENGQTFGRLAGDRGVGTFGGSQDHTAILCCRAGVISQYGFCPVKHERDVPMHPECVFAVGVSGVVAEKTAAARELYNRTSQLVSRIVQLWREATGRSDATLAAAVRSSPDAPQRVAETLKMQPDAPMLLDRFEQFVQESEQIIPAAGDALARGDLKTLDEMVARSQDLTERLLKNQVKQTIALARLAKEHGAIAASAFGAGFGGSVWALIRRADAQTFLSRWQSSYTREHPENRERASFFTTPAGPAAMVI
jgi:galactokinase